MTQMTGHDADGVLPGAEEFLSGFETFAQAVRRARGTQPQDGSGQLTLSQYSLLLPLATSGGARVSDLAAEVGIAPSTASRMLDALERRAIVARTRSAHDRRGVTVSLTPAGREALTRQVVWMRSRQMAFFAQLPSAERELIADLLVRLAALIDELSAGADA